MRIFLIILIFFIQNFAHSKEIKWKFKKRITHDNYYEDFGTATKKIKIDGKNKKIKFEIREYYPLETVMNEKEGRCKDFRIQEITSEGAYLKKNYSLNDCLPCIDKGSGYICSYPHFEAHYLYEQYDRFDKNYEVLSRSQDLTEDGAKMIFFKINLGSREQIYIQQAKLKLSDESIMDFYGSKIFKYNTRLRKIKTESSKIKRIQNNRVFLVFDSIKHKILESIKNKTKINLRNKDLEILFSTEPSATIQKYQTRD
jgi:hypothetical protein